MENMSDKPAMRFLSFANDKEDAEKEATLKEAARKIEEAITRQKSLEELIDYVAPEQKNIEDLTNDTRPLYVRLQEQKNKKKEVDEDAQKLSNFVSKLDEEDAEYLNEVEKKKRDDELRKRLEVYDALESKRRLDEQKAVLEEKRRKELLLGSTSNRKDSQINSRLSQLIKMKSKFKTPNDSSSKDSLSLEANSSQQSRSESNSTLKKTIKRSSELSDMSSEPPNKRNTTDRCDNVVGCAIKNEPDHTTKARNSQTIPFPAGQSHSSSIECSCPRVMKSIGILPSLPIDGGRHSSDEDSDNSDDDIEQRVVPHIRGRK